MMMQRRIGPHVLYLGECEAILPLLGRADLTLSDPPYGIDHLKGQSGRQECNGRRATRRVPKRIAGDDRPFDPRPLLGVADQVIIWGADHYFARLPDGGRFLAWNKLGGMEPWDSFSDVEFAWHSRPGASRIFSLLWKGLVRDKKVEGGGPRVHPMQKPVALMQWCIEQAGDEAQTIIDPYMGSGTTGVAAARMGRAFIGIEKDPDFFETACRRVEVAAAQGSFHGLTAR